MKTLIASLFLVASSTPAFAQTSRMMPNPTPQTIIKQTRLTLPNGTFRSWHEIKMRDASGNVRIQSGDGIVRIIKDRIETRLDMIRRRVLPQRGRRNEPPRLLSVPSLLPAPTVAADPPEWPDVTDEEPVELGVREINGRQAEGFIYAASFPATADFPAAAWTTEMWYAVDTSDAVRRIETSHSGRREVVDSWYIDMELGPELFEVPAGFRLPKGATLRGD